MIPDAQTAQSMREQSFFSAFTALLVGCCAVGPAVTWLVEVVRDADIDAGVTQGFHDIIWKALQRVEQQLAP